jgi:hypothetical protein
MKFTFKTEKSTGRYRSFYPDSHIIKLNKKQCGIIEESDFKTAYRIWLAVEKENINEDNNSNSTWKNIKFKKEFTSLQEAKDFLNENIDVIMKQCKLHLFE